jgi:mRNA interferase MazF
VSRPTRGTPGSGRGRKPAYAPDRGDVVWLTLDPQAGHEQAGRRTCLVLSPVIYNEKSGLAIFCPITNQVKGYPFEVPLPAGVKTTGVVLADQIKNLDWKVRKAEFREKIPLSVVREVLETALPLLAPEGDREGEPERETEP